MTAQPTFSLIDNLTQVVGGIARAVCRRPGEAQPQQMVRSQTAAHTVMEFQPRDSIEAMIAGHCVMFHEMIVDSVHTTLGGELVENQRATRGTIVAMDKAFGNNLTRLERHRAGIAKAEKQAQKVDAVAETEIVDRVRRHRPDPNEPAPMAASPRQPIPAASPQAVAACAANPEAMEALKAGDPARFARAMGVRQPSEAYLAAASAQMAGFNPQPAADRPQTLHPNGTDTGQSGRQANP
jgi:hypothetical protein